MVKLTTLTVIVITINLLFNVERKEMCFTLDRICKEWIKVMIKERDCLVLDDSIKHVLKFKI